MNLNNLNNLIELFVNQANKQNKKDIFLEWLNPSNKKSYTWEQTENNILKMILYFICGLVLTSIFGMNYYTSDANTGLILNGVKVVIVGIIIVIVRNKMNKQKNSCQIAISTGNMILNTQNITLKDLLSPHIKMQFKFETA